MGSISEAVKQYMRSEYKSKKELKALKNKNKILYRITKKSVSHREIKRIKNIRDKASKNLRHDSSDSFSDESDSDYSLSSDTDEYKHRRLDRRKEMNMLDHVVTGNTRKNKDQLNDAVYNKPKFDTNSLIYLAGLETP